jgi:putative ABC transport system permease protein
LRIVKSYIAILKAISAHKLLSFFTCTGILFGTAFLIICFAILGGYKEYMKEQMSVTGEKNIIIMPSFPLKRSLKYNNINDSLRLSAGLNQDDAASIKNEIPDASLVCTDVCYDVSIAFGLVHKETMLTGISKDYFPVFPGSLIEGENFLPLHYLYSKPVCIISSDLKKNIFGSVSPIGKWIKCNDNYLQVIGVMKAGTEIMLPEDLKMLNLNNTVYAPIQTVMLRFHQNSPPANFHNTRYAISDTRYNMLNKITVHFNNPLRITQSVEIINRLLYRRHNNVRDFRIIIPEHVIKRESAKSRISILVTFSVALLCFLMGGIAILNYIMSAYYEHSAEIKLLLSKGTSPGSVMYRFLIQGSFVGFTGGLLGIIVGIIFAKLFFDITKITTIVSFSSIIISFAVSILTGLIFSYYPARRAAIDN